MEEARTRRSANYRSVSPPPSRRASSPMPYRPIHATVQAAPLPATVHAATLQAAPQNATRISQNVGPSSETRVGGVHMVLEQEANGCIFVRTLLRGGQLSRTVQLYDRLLAVQSQSVEHLPLSRVTELIPGPEGTSIALGFIRSDPSGNYSQRFTTTVRRTCSEIVDVQLAIYEDILRLIHSGEGRDCTAAVYNEILRVHNWRSPGTVDGKAFIELVDSIMTLKSSNTANFNSVRDDGQNARLESELRIAEATASRLREELDSRDVGQVAAVCLMVDQNESHEILSDPATHKMLQDNAIYDVAIALGIGSDRVETVGIHVHDQHTIAIDLRITPPTIDQARIGRGMNAMQLANRLVQQGQDPRSPFTQTATGRKTQQVVLQREQDSVYRLRKTVDLLQDKIRGQLQSAQFQDGQLARLHELERNNTRQREEIQAKDLQLMTLMHDAAWLREEVEKIRCENVDVLEQRDVFRLEKERLQHEIIQAKQQLLRIPIVEAENGKLAKALADASATSGALADARKEHQKLLSENDELKAITNDALFKNRELMENASRLERTIEDLNTRCKNGNAEYQKLALEAQTIKVDFARCRDENINLVEKHNLLVEDANDVRIRLKQAKEDNRTLEDKCLQTQAKLQPLEQSLNQQQLGFQKWKGDYDTLRRETDRLNLENPKLRDIVRSYEDQQRRLTDEIQTLNERVQEYSDVHALDQRSNTEKDLMVRTLQEEISRLRGQVDNEKISYI